MAQGKRTFVGYCDWLTTVEKLSDKEAGMLLKHLLRYVNDQDPECENRVIELVFEPIKSQLKRDLESWELKHQRRVEAGRKGGKERAHKFKQKEAKPSNAKQSQANQPVNVNGNGNVNGNVNGSSTKKNLPKSNEPKGSIALTAELIEGIKDFYNEHRGLMAKVVTMSNSRKNLIRLRLKEYGKRGIAHAILEAEASPHWQGENDRGWVGSFDHIFDSGKMGRLIEGAYRSVKPEKEKSLMRTINEEVGNL